MGQGREPARGTIDAGLNWRRTLGEDAGFYRDDSRSRLDRATLARRIAAPAASPLSAVPSWWQ